LEKRQPLQQILLGKLTIYMQETESGPPASHPVQKSTPNGTKIFNVRTETLDYYRKREGRL
jgi:hypothetical protein